MLGFGSSWSALSDMPDITGKVALVTGGNAGIGSAICENLATRGAKVYLGARSEQRAKAAIQKIEDANPTIKEKGLIIWLPLDLTEPSDVIKAAKDFMSQEVKLDILINNAARLADDFVLSNHGIELSVAINHIGHWVLVDSLLPVLKSTAALPNSDVRIVIMSSGATAFSSRIKSLETIEELNNPWADFASNNNFIGRMRRYAFTKVLNELFKVGLMPRLEGTTITILSTDPGMVKTDNNVAGWPLLMKPIPALLGKSLNSGATTALFAATEPKILKERAKYHGAYIGPGYIGPGPNIATSPAQAQDKRLAEELWKLTEEIVNKIAAGTI